MQSQAPDYTKPGRISLHAIGRTYCVYNSRGGALEIENLKTRRSVLLRGPDATEATLYISQLRTPQSIDAFCDEYSEQMQGAE